YGCSRTSLQRLNNFTSWMLAPDVLRIPASERARTTTTNEEQRAATRAMERAGMIGRLAANFTDLSRTECKLYLDTANFDYDAAVKAASADLNWEASARGSKKMEKLKRVSVEIDNRVQFSREHDNEHVKLSPGIAMKKTPGAEAREKAEGAGGAVVKPAPEPKGVDEQTL
ncbi:hypothetical protein TeGR_g3074, partial [Tetraparma gracilis]